jgi:hypothetical protein
VKSSATRAATAGVEALEAERVLLGVGAVPERLLARLGAEAGRRLGGGRAVGQLARRPGIAATLAGEGEAAATT